MNSILLTYNHKFNNSTANLLGGCGCVVGRYKRLLASKGASKHVLGYMKGLCEKPRAFPEVSLHGVDPGSLRARKLFALDAGHALFHGSVR